MMSADQRAELKKLANEVLHPHPTQTIAAPDARHKALAQSVLALLDDTSPAQRGWREIASAPKDGTWIIGLSKRYGGTEIDRVCWGVTRGGYETWCTREGNYPLPSSITHWMPLPLPPNEETERS